MHPGQASSPHATHHSWHPHPVLPTPQGQCPGQCLMWPTFEHSNQRSKPVLLNQKPGPVHSISGWLPQCRHKPALIQHIWSWTWRFRAPTPACNCSILIGRQETHAGIHHWQQFIQVISNNSGNIFLTFTLHIKADFYIVGIFALSLIIMHHCVVGGQNSDKTFLSLLSWDWSQQVQKRKTSLGVWS